MVSVISLSRLLFLVVANCAIDAHRVLSCHWRLRKRRRNSIRGSIDLSESIVIEWRPILRNHFRRTQHGQASD